MLLLWKEGVSFGKKICPRKMSFHGEWWMFLRKIFDFGNHWASKGLGLIAGFT